MWPEIFDDERFANRTLEAYLKEQEPLRLLAGCLGGWAAVHSGMGGELPKCFGTVLVECSQILGMRSALAKDFMAEADHRLGPRESRKQPDDDPLAGRDNRFKRACCNSSGVEIPEEFKEP